MATISEALAIALRHFHSGQFQPASEICTKILRADPNQVDALHLLGKAAYRLGKRDLALSCLGRAIQSEQNAPELHLTLANIHLALSRTDEAIAGYRRALALDPAFVAAHNNLGNALKAQGNLDEAAAAYRRTLELQPDLAEAHNNLGNICREQRKLDEAVACYRRALELKPDFADAWNNLGNAFKDRETPAPAVDCFRRALELRPGFSVARNNLATALFSLGRYREAWSAFESRLALAPPRPIPAPRWNGEPLPGQTLLLHCEQGFGDSLQFLRYAALVPERAGPRRIILECPPKLARLLIFSVGAEFEIVPRAGESGQALPACDRHLPLLSLPHVLQIDEPLPMSRPYLRADPALRAAWRDRLAPTAGLRIGLVWQGNPAQSRDRFRSIPPEKLLPLFNIKGTLFYSVQHPAGSQPSLAAAGLIDLTEHLHDFAETAAFLAELDLIISVDTAVAHLAGAMGRPVWPLLWRQADWRWGFAADETPWYPTARLFRQPTVGDWDAVVARAADGLSRFQPADDLRREPHLG